jgi:hypothetical protein
VPVDQAIRVVVTSCTLAATNQFSLGEYSIPISNPIPVAEATSIRAAIF